MACECQPAAQRTVAGCLQVAKLVADLLQGLPKGTADKLTVVFADEAAAQATKQVQQHAKLRYSAIYLGDAFLDGISGMLLIAGPKQDQVSARHVLSFSLLCACCVSCCSWHLQIGPKVCVISDIAAAMSSSNMAQCQLLLI